MVQLTKNFTLEEMCSSYTAQQKHITNTPLAQHVVNLTHLCVNVLQPLRDHIGKPIHISSGYRCPTLNAAVGGNGKSQHMMGQAADISINGDKKKGREMFEWMMHNLPFDQLIMEHDKKGNEWIHVSYVAVGVNRQYVITNLEKQ